MGTQPVASTGEHTIHEFLQAWSDFSPSSAPFLLEGDQILLEPAVAQKSTIIHAGWEGFVSSPEFGAPDKRLHLALLPQPFSGPIKTASVIILMLNPGLNPVDYFGEYKVPEFRDALLRNLKGFQEHTKYPNMFLNPEFSWHSGFGYCYGKFRELIRQHADAAGWSLTESLQVFSREIAFLELYPYHSESFGLPRSVSSKLRSVELALAYAHDVLLPRARDGRVLLLVMRQSSAWRLAEERGVVVYGRSEARGAHLGPRSRGGQAILNFIPAS